MPEPPGDDGPKIVEPPFDAESDTRPLKPLRRPDEQGPEKVIMPRVRRRPATILQEASTSAAPVLPKPAPPTSEDTDRVRLVPKQPEPPPWRLILTTSGAKQSTIGLDVREALVIGRVEQDEAQAPTFDLSPHMAFENGISRQHAVLIPSVDALYLVDLDSTNGTWINGMYLEPGQRYALSVGDRVELGLLRLTVKSVSMLGRTPGGT
jgi:hypothetical protein